MWGTWWVWDARLTSVFILFVMYLGLIALTRALDDPARSARAAAVITLVGFVNIPIIKFSVDWWNTLHQPASVFRLDGPTIHSEPAVAAARHGARLHATFLHAASRRHADGDLAPPGRGHATGRGAARGAWRMSAHGLYVMAAYGLSALALLITIGWIVIDHRGRRRDLAELEARGIRRRSDAAQP
jgi:heme exporter protein CcmD